MVLSTIIKRKGGMEKRKRARLLIASKLTLASGYIEEAKIWSVPVSGRYPDGIRFRLVLVDRSTGEIALLYDNHRPKGPHIHAGGVESRYRFRSVERLLNDFLEHVSRIEESNR